MIGRDSANTFSPREVSSQSGLAANLQEKPRGPGQARPLNDLKRGGRESVREQLTWLSLISLSQSLFLI